MLSKPKIWFFLSLIILMVISSWVIHNTWNSSLQETKDKAVDLAEAAEAGFQKSMINKLEADSVALEDRI